MSALNRVADISALRADLAASGQVVVRDLVERDDVERFRQIVHESLAVMRRIELPPGQEIYQQAFDQYMNLWRANEAAAAITLNSALARTAAALLGVEAVRVYHDQALVKVAGGGHTPWHQDQWYWPLDTDRTITMWLPLHDVEPEMGDLEFALGTHAGPIGDEPISGESDAFYDDYLASNEVTRRRTGAMSAGDASFHMGWALHRANPNNTEVDREVMTIIWFADGARVTEPENPGQRLDLRIWLPGLSPGDVAATELNPLVGGAP